MKIEGNRPTHEAESLTRADAAKGNKPAPRTAVVPASTAGAEPAANGKQTRSSFIRHGTLALQRAAREDDAR